MQSGITNRFFANEKSASLFLTLLLLPAVAFAHTGAGMAGGFSSGFMHPLSGLDHMLAMLAVGMWGAQLGLPAIWMLPVAFPVIMAMGGVLGIVGFPMPMSVEWGVVISVVVLGVAIALNLRPWLWLSVAMVGFFGLFHGYAHGAELPGHANALNYSIGFVLATGMIHIVGILIGLVTKLPRGMGLLRTAGAAIAAAGIYLTYALAA